jgi:AmmeMemoRadiSam system protein A
VNLTGRRGPGSSIMITDEDRRALLGLARDAITAYVRGLPPPVTNPSPIMSRLAGVFVSLHKDHALRGCIGHLEADRTLGRSVPEMAVAAASCDPRFPPVTADELSELDIELSVLGELEPIGGAGDIEIGRHGLLVEFQGRRGLLLPQVAVEWQWDTETFLAQTCHKAGLARDAWRAGASIRRFTAEVFSET